MRSDNLKKHIKIHENSRSKMIHQPNVESVDDLPDTLMQTCLYEIPVTKEKKRQKVVDITDNLGVPIPQDVIDTQSVEEDDLQKQLIDNKNIYLEKVAMGKKIYTSLHSGGIPEESLIKAHKHALELYRKYPARYFRTCKRLLSQIPPTEKKKWPQKSCVNCRKHGTRRDTRYICSSCNVPLCKTPCFLEHGALDHQRMELGV